MESECSCWEMSGDAGRAEDPPLVFGMSEFPKSSSVLSLVLCLSPKGVRYACLLGVWSLIGRNEFGKRLNNVKVVVVYQCFAA